MTPIFRKVLLPICYERVAAFSRILSKEITKNVTTCGEREEAASAFFVVLYCS